MFERTDIPECRWYTVEADDERAARINCIAHLLSVVPYQPVPQPIESFPARHPTTATSAPPRTGTRSCPTAAAGLTR